MRENQPQANGRATPSRRGVPKEPPKPRSILLTELDYRDQAVCYHHYERDAVFNAVFTTRAGQKHERKLCWACVKRIYDNMDLIESFATVPITADLLRTAEPDGDEDIPF